MTHEEAQADTSSRWVLLAKHAKLSQQAAKLASHDGTVEAAAGQALDRLRAFALEYSALELHRRGGDMNRIPELAPELQNRFDQISGVLDCCIGVGPQGTAKRREVLELASSHLAGSRDGPIDYADVADALNVTQNAPMDTRSKVRRRLTPNDTKELIDAIGELQAELNDRIRQMRSLFQDPGMDAINGFQVEPGLSGEISRLDAQIREGASPTEQAALRRTTKQLQNAKYAHTLSWDHDRQPDKFEAGLSGPSSPLIRESISPISSFRPSPGPAAPGHGDNPAGFPVDASEPGRHDEMSGGISPLGSRTSSVSPRRQASVASTEFPVLSGPQLDVERNWDHDAQPRSSPLRGADGTPSLLLSEGSDLSLASGQGSILLNTRKRARSEVDNSEPNDIEPAAQRQRASLYPGSGGTVGARASAEIEHNSVEGNSGSPAHSSPGQRRGDRQLQADTRSSRYETRSRRTENGR
ncbi:hypothetical protein [Mesorhizobium sp. GbtcB19]|uniref:hypothetical protein n=1 Tax=Mesorhizobium sp. GbtcB19 TaxID=2824764 RepID=UPI001C2F465E|nr:hypothetical protein [Mesorhizobium sp. GbtcB19]